MPETSVSLLERLRVKPDTAAWRRFMDLYTPLIRGCLRRHQLQISDADDVVQEVLVIVVEKIPHFKHNQRPGAFRNWLRTTTGHCLRRLWREGTYRPDAAGGSSWEEILRQFEDPNSGLSRLWEEEHDRHVLRRLLELIEIDFESSTWQAFRRLVLELVPAAEVAAELGLSVNAVNIAKSRVLQRLRQEARGLLD